ncbi:hypothetical protein, partial [Pseudomonas syringae]|uniref:hypothetical protein n=1 Tax=Pseudomonas syringae TaxID=317 RepID=UPI00217E5620
SLQASFFYMGCVGCVKSGAMPRAVKALLGQDCIQFCFQLVTLYVSAPKRLYKRKTSKKPA